MIDVKPVWKRGYTGKGIRLRINDDGLAYNHEEFEGRFDFEGSCGNAENLRVDGDHGTNVASIAGASGDNGACGVGISPNVILSACDAFNLSSRIGIFDFELSSHDISQNSFGIPGCLQAGTGETNDGNRRRTKTRKRRRRNLQTATCPFKYKSELPVGPCDVCDFTTVPPTSTVGQLCDKTIISHCLRYFTFDQGCVEFVDLLIEDGECLYNVLDPDDAAGITAGVTGGRDGKGIIYLVAVGNDLAAGSDANFEGLVNTRLTISVGAVGKDELHASYSTPGASLFVVAPGGDQESLTNLVAANAAGGCHDAGIGTSYACPVVSGVVALILEANNDLTWRDVQGILASTSRAVTNDRDDSSFVTNAAGFMHSNFYGFGIVNANEAVAAAETWENFPKESLVAGESGVLNLPIVDKSSSTTSPVISTIEITPDQDQSSFFTETVAILLDIRHFSRGDLEVILTSPGGTSSVMSPGNRPERTQLDVDERWKLTTVRSWGESPFGTWTLSVTDISEGDLDACADHLWDLDVSGQVLRCSYFMQNDYCVDGEVDYVAMSFSGSDFLIDLKDEDSGLTPVEACCACGGGRSRADGDAIDMVVEWRILVYGHPTDETAPADTTWSPTMRPTTRPTTAPTLSSTLTSDQITDPTFSPSVIQNEVADNIPPSPGPSTISTPQPSGIPMVAQDGSDEVPSIGVEPTDTIPTPQPTPFPEIDAPSFIPPFLQFGDSSGSSLSEFVAFAVCFLVSITQIVLFE